MRIIHHLSEKRALHIIWQKITSFIHKHIVGTLEVQKKAPLPQKAKMKIRKL